MQRQSILSPTQALIITNVYVLLSFILAFAGSRLGVEILGTWLLISPVLTGLFATGAALLAARASVAGDSRPWQALFVGFGLWTLAEIIWAFGGQVVAASAPTAADWLWMLGYVPVGVAIQLQLNRSRASLKWLKVAFTVLIGVAFAGLFTSLVISPLYEGTPLNRGLAAVLNLLYPALDITLMIGSLLILQSSPGGSPWRVVAIALLFWVYADLVYAILNWVGVYGINGMSLFSVDIPYNLAYLLGGVACVQAASIAHTVRADSTSAVQPV